MAVTLTGTGGLFTRLGKIIAAIRNINGFRAGTATDTTALWGSGGPTVYDTDHAISNITAQFLSTQQTLMDGIYTTRDNFKAAQGTMLSALRDLASKTIIEMVHADAVLPAKTIDLAMFELVRQLTASSDSVKACTVSASTAAVSGNTGDATIIGSCTGPKGLAREYVFPEVVELRVTNDYQGGASLGSEALSIRGENALNDTLDPLWPDGSGATGSLTMVNQALNQDSQGNLLYNSSFDTFTVANTPDHWSILVGAAGTDIFSEASVIYRTGGKALKFTGTGGSPLSSVALTFNNSGGTTSVLKPDTVYAVNYFLKDSGAGLTAGVIKVDLVDGTNTVINDDAGTANSKTTAYSVTTASYAAVNAFFRTPKLLPSTIKLRVSISTALTSGESMYIDELAMTEAAQLYTGGPYFAAFRGATDALLGDGWNVTIANNNLGIFQTMFEQLFGMRALGLQLPSAGSPTIAESLCA